MKVADPSVWPTRYRRRRALYKVVLGERSIGRPYRVLLPLFNTWGFVNTNPRRISSLNTVAVDRAVYAFGLSYE
jgi:predicted membrane-bound spermidine synthase